MDVGSRWMNEADEKTRNGKMQMDWKAAEYIAWSSKAPDEKHYIKLWKVLANTWHHKFALLMYTMCHVWLHIAVNKNIIGFAL